MRLPVNTVGATVSTTLNATIALRNVAKFDSPVAFATTTTATNFTLHPIIAIHSLV